MSAYIELGLFLITATMAVSAAVSVVLHRKLQLGALALVVSLTCIAALLVLLRAPVPAAALLVLPAGAVVALILLVLVLLDSRVEVRSGRGERFQRGMSLVAGACLVGLLGLALRRSRDPFAIRSLDGDAVGSLTGFAGRLFGDDLLSLELAGLLVLVALAGALRLGRFFFAGAGRP